MCLQNPAAAIDGLLNTFTMCMSRSIFSGEKHSFLVPDKSAIKIAIHQGASIPVFMGKRK